jgi:hypothetical protein
MAGFVGSNQTAMFMPRIFSVTAGPVLDWLTVTLVCAPDVTVTVADFDTDAPPEAVTVRV